MAKATKYVYAFGNKKADGDGSMKPLLGGKGANLAEMTRIGLPVPPGFTITTEVCTYYYAHKKTYPKELQGQMEAGIANMEKIMGTKFGATNAMHNRRHTLTGRSRFAAAREAYEPMRRADGKLPSSWEVVYAHAWAPAPGAPIREQGHDVASVPLSAIPIRRKTKE